MLVCGRHPTRDRFEIGRARWLPRPNRRRVMSGSTSIAKRAAFRDSGGTPSSGMVRIGRLPRESSPTPPPHGGRGPTMSMPGLPRRRARSGAACRQETRVTDARAPAADDIADLPIGRLACQSSPLPPAIAQLLCTSDCHFFAHNERTEGPLATGGDFIRDRAGAGCNTLSSPVRRTCRQLTGLGRLAGLILLLAVRLASSMPLAW